MGIAQDFNGHNTTLSAAVNYESDLSFPIGGTPTPPTEVNGNRKGPDPALHEVDAVVGITQVMNRRWLATLSYSYTDQHGTDRSCACKPAWKSIWGASAGSTRLTVRSRSLRFTRRI